jgi:hypothetical protein
VTGAGPAAQVVTWWQQPATGVLITMADTAHEYLVLSAMARLLHAGRDPEWLVGGRNESAAVSATRTWLDEGFEPGDVEGWLWAGCPDPRLARQLGEHGIEPDLLLDEHRQPTVMVDKVGPNRESLPAAEAFARGYVSANQVVQKVAGTKPRTSGSTKQAKR